MAKREEQYDLENRLTNALLNKSRKEFEEELAKTVYDYLGERGGSYHATKRGTMHSSVLSDMFGLTRDSYAQLFDAVGKRGEFWQLHSGTTALVPRYSSTNAVLMVNKALKKLKSGSGRIDDIRPRIGIGFSKANAGLPAPNIVPYDPNLAFMSMRGRSGGNVFGEMTDVNPLFADTNWAYNEAPAADQWTAETFPVATMEQAEKFKSERANDEKLKRAKTKSDLDALKRQRKAQEQREEEAYQARRFKRRERRDAYKEYPWMKAIAKHNPSIGKNLPEIAKSLHELTKTPGFGRAIGTVAKNPSFMLPLLGYGALVGMLGRSDQANTRVVDWQNAANLSGAPSKRFSELALLAGDKDPAAIARRFGKATLKFGDAEMFYRSLAPQIKDMPPIARMAIAKDLGLDETDFAIMDMMSGRIKPDRIRRATAGKGMAETAKEIGLSSGAGVFDTLEAWRLSIPGMSSAAARDYADIQYVRTRSDLKYGAYMDEYVNKAIGSADEYSRSYGIGASNEPAGGGKVVNVTINTGALNLPNVENAQDFADEMSGFSEERVEAAEAFDPKGM